MDKRNDIWKRPLFVLAAAGLAGVWTLSAALADAPTKTRQDVMKSVGFATKTAAAMVKGKAPYDPVKAELAMRTVNAAITGFPHLFPEGSTTGDETEASPKIWEDMKGFLHIADEVREHSAVAAGAAKKGLDEFKKEFAATTKYCKECHKEYRIKKKK
jgi:cytochrome c556